MKLYLYTLGLFCCLIACTSQPEKHSDENTENVDPSKEVVAEDTIPEDTVAITEVEVPNADTLLMQIENGERKFDFYANFTEPFFTLYFIDQWVLFNLMDEGPEVYPSNASFDSEADQQTIVFDADGSSWEVFIEKGSGSDGMSDLNYTYKVLFDQTLRGGGAEEFLKPE